MLLRPMTTHSLPLISTPVERMSSMTPAGGAGQEAVVADHDFAHVVGVEGVHVLFGVDVLHHQGLVQTFGQGGLD